MSLLCVCYLFMSRFDQICIALLRVQIINHTLRKSDCCDERRKSGGGKEYLGTLVTKKELSILLVANSKM